MALPRLHAARLHHDHGAGRCSELLADTVALSGRKRRGRFDRRVGDLHVNLVVDRDQRGGGVATVGDHKIRRRAPGPPLGPMLSRERVVRPEHKGYTGATYDSREQRVRPRRVTNHAIEPLAGKQRRERAPRSMNRMRPARSCLAQLVNAHAGGIQFACKTAVETKGGFHVELCARRQLPGERQQHRFNAAEQVPAVHVQNAHARSISG